MKFGGSSVALCSELKKAVSSWTSDDKRWMVWALVLAEEAFRAEEVPVGAVVVMGGRVVGEARNEVEGLKDPTAHAEILALRRASKAVGQERLTGASLYVTLEPCAMCAGALIWARAERLIFGARDEKAGCAGSLYNLPRDSRFNHRLEVQGGLMAEKGIKLLQTFFQERRSVSR